MENIDQIRKAITANHGGFEMATDAQILAVWDSLPEEKRQQYMVKDLKNADWNKQEPDVQCDSGQ